MLSISSFRPGSTADRLLPSVGDEIDFATPGTNVYGAMVTKKEYFSDQWHFFVKYTFQGYDGRLYANTGWVAQEAVL